MEKKQKRSKISSPMAFYLILFAVIADALQFLIAWILAGGLGALGGVGLVLGQAADWIIYIGAVCILICWFWVLGIPPHQLILKRKGFLDIITFIVSTLLEIIPGTGAFTPGITINTVSVITAVWNEEGDSKLIKATKKISNATGLTDKVKQLSAGGE